MHSEERVVIYSTDMDSLIKRNMKTKVKESLEGWEVEFTIDHQTFTLMEMNTKESAEMIRGQLEIALNRLSISHVCAQNDGHRRLIKKLQIEIAELKANSSDSIDQVSDLFMNIDQDGDVLSIHKTEEGAINRRWSMLHGGVPEVQVCKAQLEE